MKKDGQDTVVAYSLSPVTFEHMHTDARWERAKRSMTNELQRMDFAHCAENLQQVFEQVKDSNQPIIVERDGEFYRLARETTEDLWASYDPEKVQQALAASRGLFAGTDREAFLTEIHDQRQQGPNRFD